MGLPYERELLSLMRNMLGVTVALCRRWGLGKDFTSEAQPQVRLRLTTAPFHANNNHALQIVAGVSHSEWVTRTHNELRCNVRKRMSQWFGVGHWLCLLAHEIKPAGRSVSLAICPVPCNSVAIPTALVCVCS